MRLVAALLLLSGTAQASTALFEIPVEQPAAADVAASTIEFELHVQDPARLARVLQTDAPATGATFLRYRPTTYPQLPSPAGRTWLEATFLVDHQEPAVRRQVSKWRRSAQRRPDANSLVRYVSSVVRERYGRGFDIASTVAQRLEGDCTEHAVLTTALARAAGLRSRVVMGVALVIRPGDVQAYGHAWSEIEQDGRWVIADAALGDEGLVVHYLPHGVIADERAGFMLEVMRFTPLMFSKVVVRH